MDAVSSTALRLAQGSRQDLRHCRARKETLGRLLLDRGDVARAAPLVADSLGVLWEIGSNWDLTPCAGACGSRDWRPAVGQSLPARLLGAAAAGLREAMPYPIGAGERGDTRAPAGRGQCGAWGAGVQAGLDRRSGAILGRHRGRGAGSAGNDRARGHGRDPRTLCGLGVRNGADPREQEASAMLREWSTYAETAARLFLSPPHRRGSCVSTPEASRTSRSAATRRTAVRRGLVPPDRGAPSAYVPVLPFECVAVKCRGPSCGSHGGHASRLPSCRR